jgi:hypothetical protein
MKQVPSNQVYQFSWQLWVIEMFNHNLKTKFFVEMFFIKNVPLVHQHFAKTTVC